MTKQHRLHKLPQNIPKRIFFLKTRERKTKTKASNKETPAYTIQFSGLSERHVMSTWQTSAGREFQSWKAGETMAMGIYGWVYFVCTLSACASAGGGAHTEGPLGTTLMAEQTFVVGIW